MNAVAFDTHAFIKRLTAVGMPEAQAEALADEQRRLIDDRLATKEDIARSDAATKIEIARLEAATKAELAKYDAATKAELAKYEAATKADIARLEAATKSEFAIIRRDIELVKHELTIRVGGMVMALGGVLIAIKFLGR